MHRIVWNKKDYTFTGINNKINIDNSRVCKYSYLKGEDGLGCWCPTPLSTIFHLYRSGQGWI